jgi:hypothetical protein
MCLLVLMSMYSKGIGIDRIHSSKNATLVHVRKIIPVFQHITWLVRYLSLNFLFADTKTTNQSMRKILMNQSIFPCLINPHGLYLLFGS